ncbi:MAG: hypothetical protein R3F56_08550 [Planctomycetota bacterium]
MVTPSVPHAPVLRMVAVRGLPWFGGAELSVHGNQCLAIAATAGCAEHFGDLVQGLRAPAAGAVEVCGVDWRGLSAHAAYALRGKVRRLAPSMDWIQNLNVDENVLLPMLDLSSVPERELRARAETMAQRVGLDAIPCSRPHDTARDDLWASAAIRTFLGEPALVVVEPLPRDLPAPVRSGIVALAGEARANGAALLWLDGREPDLACDGHGELRPDTVLEFPR